MSVWLVTEIIKSKDARDAEYLRGWVSFCVSLDILVGIFLYALGMYLRG